MQCNNKKVPVGPTPQAFLYMVDKGGHLCQNVPLIYLLLGAHMDSAGSPCMLVPHSTGCGLEETLQVVAAVDRRIHALVAL